MQAFDFTEADLAANENGYLTERQRENMRQEMAYVKKELYWVWAISMGIAGLFLIWILSAMSELGFLLLAVGVALALINGLFFYLVTDSSMKRDLQQGRASKICGEVRLRVVRKDELDEPYRKYNLLIIKGKQIPISNRGYEALKEYESYCVYYTPRTKYILSIKPIATKEVFEK